MKFERITESQVPDPKNNYAADSFVVFRETTTDVLFLELEGMNLLEMHDPETGLPLTYKVWKEKYKPQKSKKSK